MLVPYMLPEKMACSMNLPSAISFSNASLKGYNEEEKLTQVSLVAAWAETYLSTKW
jgi:hypothetical protein